jgi:hypothetical protein
VKQRVERATTEFDSEIKQGAFGHVSHSRKRNVVSVFLNVDKAMSERSCDPVDVIRTSQDRKTGQLPQDTNWDNGVGHGLVY